MRGRFRVALAGVLLPFILAAILGQFVLLPALTDPLKDTISDVLEELEPVTELRAALRMCAWHIEQTPQLGALLNSEMLVETSAHVDHAFLRVLAMPHQTADRSRAQGALMEWEGVKHALSATPHVEAGSGAFRERLTTRLAFAAKLLDEVHQDAMSRMDGARAKMMRATRYATLATVIAFLAAAVISVAAGFMTVNPIIQSVDLLHRGAARLAAGELSHRVQILRDDEFGRLGQSFNAMADNIEAAHNDLRQLSTTDNLTGLYNQRSSSRRLQEELERSRRYKHEFSVLVLDLDHFKSVNDRYGHPVGDKVLQSAAEVMRQALRPSDHAARTGGEEFTVILPETDTKEAAMAAERIRSGIASTSTPLADGTSLRVTVSIGMATFPKHAESAEALVRVADEALYSAKREGRNRAVVHDGPLQPA